MKAALINLGSKGSKLLLEAMHNYFDEVDDINIKQLEVNLCHKFPKVLHGWEALKKYDCVYVRGSYRYAQLLRVVSSYLEDRAYIPISPTAFTIGHDKILTHVALMKKGIPIPSTYIASSSKAAKPHLKKVEYPIVLKLPTGTQGKGVMFADSYAGASSLLDTLESLRVPFMIQQYIESDGKDVRCFVVGNKVVACMERTSSDGEKRSNLHAGGSGKHFKCNKMVEQIALSAAKALKASICGVDIIIDDGEAYVLEVNISPGVYGITKATGVDVPDKIAKYLHAKTKKRVEEEESIFPLLDVFKPLFPKF